MQKKVFRRFLTTLGIFATVLLINTRSVNAASPRPLASGSAGASISWTLYDSGEIKFVGSGDMYDYLDAETKETDGMQDWYKYRNAVSKITIGEGITSIGDGAFFGFNETEIIWPTASLTEIGISSFANNTRLGKIVLPSSVTQINAKAFSNCKAAKVIEIKGSVDTIGEEAFTEMTDTVITIAPGCRILRSKSFYGSAKRIEFPSTVTAIASNCMNTSNKWQLIKGGSSAAKRYAENNFIAYIDNSRTYDAQAVKFSLNNDSYCYTGKAIEPDITVKFSDGSQSAPLVINKDYELVFGSDNSKDLGKHSVTVRGIGSFNFTKTFNYKIVADISECKIKLAYESIAANKTARKPSVKVTLSGMTLKEGIHYSVKYEDNVSAGIASVIITGKSRNFAVGSETLNFTIFDKKRFYYDGSIYIVTKVTDSVKEVMLADADVDLSKFVVPDTVEFEDEEYDVVEIGQYAFKNCKKAKSITVGSNVKSIKDGAFYGCVNLTTVKLPNSLKTIGNKVFVNCLKLKSITIPKNVKSIGKSAFLGCKLLSSVTLKTDLLTSSSVGASAFKNIHRKAIIYCNPKKVADYKKILAKRGLTGSSQKVLPIKK
ncbi:MAG: leucine-rich repeat domain-containing protein [Lachnospiraceae bacterium]|nr:leucine-rich repeat domain-containing protein [Lachnospiraceae bacterium]